jgi:acetyltransferase
MPAPNPFKKIFNPKSIAIIGASRAPEKVGYQILKNIIDSGYTGAIYPINPNAETILKLKCYPTLAKINREIDLTIIVTPAPLVSPLIAECAEHHIENAIIITAGFAESGPKGVLLQQQLKDTLKKYPVNVLGPNCLGALSPINHINATFGPKMPQKGSIMLISQSGALVTGIIDWANKMDIGLSHAVTFGNRIGIGEIEALTFAAEDKSTNAILVYLESFQNAREFFSACSKITPQKPIIFLKGGQSLAGQTASASHTAALASNYVLAKAFAKQTGVIICDTIQEWLNLAAAFAHVPPAKSTDLTILTNAGGPGVLSTDEASNLDLELPELSKETKQKILAKLPRLNPHNPLDILGDASPEDFAAALSVLNKDKQIHNLLTIVTPQTTTKPLETAAQIINSQTHARVPTYAVMIGGDKMAPARKLLSEHHILNFDFPTQALQIIAAKAAYESKKHLIFKYPAEKPSFTSQKNQEKIVNHLQKELSLNHAFEVLNEYGFHLPKSAIIDQLQEVGQAVEYVGRPAVAKTAGLSIAHKAQVGGVVLNLMTTIEARLAFRKLQTLHKDVLFQQMIKGELELILGAKRDAQLGPFITVGLGGTLTNTLEDRAYAFLPATKTYLTSIFNQTKAAAAMHKKHIPIAPVIDAMERLTAVLLDIECIEELEINPAIISKKHLYAADIKITLKS